MKNKRIALVVLSFSLLVFSSCATRKYGCPNTTGTKLAKTVESLAA